MESNEIDLLARADYIYPMSERCPILKNAEIAVKDGIIIYIGARKEEGTWEAKEILEGKDNVILPGFVNCHTHAASIIFRSQTDDANSKAGLYNVAFRMEKDITPDEWHAQANLGCVDLLKSGVTTINDVWYEPEGLAIAAENSGLRAVIAHKVFDVHLENLSKGDYTHYPEIGNARLKYNVEFIEKWQGAANGRITTRIGTHATDTCDSNLLKEARAEATRLGVGMHTHAAQTPREVAHIKDTFGSGPLEYLQNLDVLKSDVILAHLTYASDADLQAVSDSGANYAHCPIIYPRRGIYPRLMDIVNFGITTGFATDWMMNDPFEGMRYAINSVRVLGNDYHLMSSVDALWYQTMGSAKALNMDDQIGSLEVGKKADFMILDVAKSHLQPFYGDYASIVFYAKSTDVTTVVVDGEIVVKNGNAVLVDQATLLNDVMARRDGWLHALGTLSQQSH